MMVLRSQKGVGREHTESYDVRVSHGQKLRGRRWSEDKINTWDNITSIHFVFVFDEAKAIHEFDLLNLGTSMLGKVGFHVGLGSYGVRVSKLVEGGPSGQQESEMEIQTTTTDGRSNNAVRESYQYVEGCLGRGE
jgi:hypothetical protein